MQWRPNVHLQSLYATQQQVLIDGIETFLVLEFTLAICGLIFISLSKFQLSTNNTPKNSERLASTMLYRL